MPHTQRGTTQTLVSAKIKMAIQRIGTVILGEPLTAESMRKPFMEIGLENELAKPLSLIVEIYGVTRHTRGSRKCCASRGQQSGD